MERFFQIAAVALAGTAAYFYSAGYTDSMYIAVVLGAVAFFFSIRAQVKERNRRRDIEREAGMIDNKDEMPGR
jgi:hypothetical protein